MFSVNSGPICYRIEFIFNKHNRQKAESINMYIKYTLTAAKWEIYFPFLSPERTKKKGYKGYKGRYKTL